MLCYRSAKNFLIDSLLTPIIESTYLNVMDCSLFTLKITHRLMSRCLRHNRFLIERFVKQQKKWSEKMRPLVLLLLFIRSRCWIETKSLQLTCNFD